MWLLMDLFEHEMLESALFYHAGIPGEVLHIPGHGLAVEIRYVNTSRRDYRQIAVVQEKQIACMRKQGRNVGSHKVFAGSQADDQGWSIARSHNLVWLFGGDHCQGEDPRKFFHRLTDCIFQLWTASRAVVDQVFFYQVSNDLCICLRGKNMSFFRELAFQRKIVFNDSVVDYDNLAGAIAMWMGIFFAWPSMSGPARVANPISAVEWLQADDLFKVFQLAFGPAYLQGFRFFMSTSFTVTGNGNSC